MCRRVRPTSYTWRATDERIWSKRTSRSSGGRCICQPTVARKNGRASAKEYDDQVGDADGDDAADDGQQQDALKSGHSTLLGRLASVSLSASTIICFPETAGAGAIFA